MAGKRLKLFACEILHNEIEPLIEGCLDKIDVTYVTIGLHSKGSAKMSQELQKLLDEVDPIAYRAILLGYGLCGYGIRGLHAAVPIVVPRVHDWTALFMGSHKAYKEYFDSHSGTFFFNSGTLEFYKDSPMFSDKSAEQIRNEYAALYDEETADYLMDVLGDPLREYNRLTLIDTGAKNIPESRIKALAIARERAWAFDEMKGSARILQQLLSGAWNDDAFLIVPPGSVIEPSYSETIIKSVKSEN